jgi:hypothetical protein
MPIKQGLLPKKHIVIRDLKRGVVNITAHEDRKEKEFFLTLQNSMINEKHHKEINPNNPLETDIVNAYDVKLLRWVSFKISELEIYNPAHLGVAPNVGENNSVRGEEGEDSRRTGYRSSEASQETQTNDRGAESSSN